MLVGSRPITDIAVVTKSSASHVGSMHTMTAYERRDTLSDNDLARLRSALIDEVDRYRKAIRGYEAEKMQLFGEPYLRKLQTRVDVVSDLQRERERDGS